MGRSGGRWQPFKTEELGALVAALMSTHNGPYLVLTDEIKAELDRRVVEQNERTGREDRINWGGES